MIVISVRPTIAERGGLRERPTASQSIFSGAANTADNKSQVSSFVHVPSGVGLASAVMSSEAEQSMSVAPKELEDNRVCPNQ